MSSSREPEAPAGAPIKRWHLIVGGALVVGAFLIGYVGSGGDEGGTAAPATAAAAEDPTMWTCSMHPSVMLPEPGQCPICGMDLIPANSGSGADDGPREITLSEHARKLADIRVAPVERKHVDLEIRMVGKVDYDERRVGTITAWVGGRIEKLYVDFTGEKVRKGAPMVSLYSPDLLSAQEELLAAMRAAKELERSKYDTVRSSTEETVHAVRERLRLWGLTPKQIDAIARSGKATEHVIIHAPMAGTVVHKAGSEGMYVDTGTPIYRIADLTKLWVMLDAYETDIPWLYEDQNAEFTTEAYPGETFQGRVTFVDPVVSDRTRTVKVRLEVDNAGGRLKPGMFVRAIVRARATVGATMSGSAVAGDGAHAGHGPAGKSAAKPKGAASPAGVAAVAVSEPPLVIPTSAALVAGKRAVVYVADPVVEGRFAGREVVLGPRAGDYYVVRSGLSEGEKVVVNGAFKIDSSLQILAKPSMMSPEGAPVPGHDHGSGAPPAGGHEHARTEVSGEPPAFDAPHGFHDRLGKLIGAYFVIHKALSNDHVDEAKAAATSYQKLLAAVDAKLLPKGEARDTWVRLIEAMQTEAQGLAAAPDIGAARVRFASLTTAVLSALASFGTGGATVYRLHCPMALDNKGANWLQPYDRTENPYFGASMFSCGSVTGTLEEHGGH